MTVTGLTDHTIPSFLHIHLVNAYIYIYIYIYIYATVSDSIQPDIYMTNKICTLDLIQVRICVGTNSHHVHGHEKKGDRDGGQRSQAGARHGAAAPSTVRVERARAERAAEGPGRAAEAAGGRAEAACRRGRADRRGAEFGRRGAGADRRSEAACRRGEAGRRGRAHRRARVGSSSRRAAAQVCEGNNLMSVLREFLQNLAE
jgi:hypothetical protein